MATRQELREILKYDLERVPLPGESKASDGALAVLEAIQTGERETVERALAYAERDTDVHAVKTADLLRTLQHADGRLALVRWGNAGIKCVGYRPSEQRYDVGGYSAVRDIMGDDPEHYETCTRAKAAELLRDGRPDIVRREEAGLLEPLSHGGGGR